MGETGGEVTVASFASFSLEARLLVDPGCYPPPPHPRLPGVPDLWTADLSRLKVRGGGCSGLSLGSPRAEVVC